MLARLPAGRLFALALALTIAATGAAVGLTTGPAAAAPLKPVQLRAFTGGPLVQLLWAPGDTTQAPKYRVYRDNDEIATVDRNNDTVTPTNRYTDRSAPINQAATYQVAAIDAAGVVGAKSDAITVTRPRDTDTTPVPTVPIDASTPGDVLGKLRTQATLIREWYPQFADFLARPAYAPPRSVILKTGDLSSIHAAASADGNVITYDLAWLRNPENASGLPGTTLHEMVHVIQAGYNCTSCSWVAESVAVWATHNIYTDAAPVITPKSAEYYLDAYSAAEPLLNWVISNYNKPRLVRDLNIAAHDSSSSDIDSFFVTQTTVGGTAGRTPRYLWDELAVAKGVAKPTYQSLRLTGSGLPGECVEVPWDDLANPPAAATCWDTTNQVMVRFQVNGGGSVYRNLKLWGQCLDLPDGAVPAGTAVAERDCRYDNPPTRQQWAPQGDNTLRNVLTGLCLQAGTAPPSDPGHRPLTIERCTGSTSQQWTADPR